MSTNSATFSIETETLTRQNLSELVMRLSPSEIEKLSKKVCFSPERAKEICKEWEDLANRKA